MKTKTRDIYIWNSENGWYVLAAHQLNPLKHPTLTSGRDGWTDDPSECYYFQNRTAAAAWRDHWMQWLPNDNLSIPQPEFKPAPLWPLLVAVLLICMGLFWIAFRICQVVDE